MNSDSHPVDENKNRNREHVDRIIAKINGMFDLTEDRQNVTYGMEILKDMLSLDPDYRDDNDKVLQPWHLYLAILTRKIRLDIDTTVRNDEVKSYTDFICSHKEKILEIFTFPRFQKVLMIMISNNLALHDIDGYERIMKEYSSKISYYYRPIVYNLVMKSTCGKLDMDREIYTLYDRFDINIVYYKDRPTEPILLKNLFTISKELNIEDRAGQLYRFMEERHPYYKGQLSESVINYYLELSKYGFHMDRVRAWVDSVDRESIPKKSVEDYNMTVKLLNGEVEVDETVFNLIGDPFEDLFALCDYRNLDRNYPRGALHGEVLRAMDYYRYCSHETGVDEGERLYKCNMHYYDLKIMERSLRFWSDFEKAVNFFDISDNHKGVFFFVNEWSLVNASLALPMIMAAEKNGHIYIPVSSRMSVKRQYKDPFLDEIAGMFTADEDKRHYAKPYDGSNYEIDLPLKKIIVQGMNVYQPIYEFVARYQFSYFLNYDTDAWARKRVNQLTCIYDRLFTYIADIEEWAVKNNRKVYFLSHAPHVHNAAAFRIYCEEKNESGLLNYICVSGGYDNYFKNIGDAKTETITALNLTKHPHSRNAFLGTKEGFEEYYEKRRADIGQVKAKAIEYLSMHRGVGNKHVDKAEKKRILKLIRQYKKAGKKVYLINGKVIFDLAVKYTQGCVHGDMSEWITHAVDFAKSRDDILLLIKPHPHEKREDLTLTSNKVHTLRSIIKTELADNTIFLDHDMFKNQELTPYVDLGLVWNGTSSLEFAALGIHVLVGDVWGHYDYPIGFARPETMEEYESWLADPSLIKEPEDLSDRAVMFLDYMGSEDVRIENRYSRTTTLNFNQFDSSIDLNAVYDYFDRGDGKLDRLFESLL